LILEAREINILCLSKFILISRHRWKLRVTEPEFFTRVTIFELTNYRFFLFLQTQSDNFLQILDPNANESIETAVLSVNLSAYFGRNIFTKLPMETDFVLILLHLGQRPSVWRKLTLHSLDYDCGIWIGYQLCRVTKVRRPVIYTPNLPLIKHKHTVTVPFWNVKHSYKTHLQ